VQDEQSQNVPGVRDAVADKYLAKTKPKGSDHVVELLDFPWFFETFHGCLPLERSQSSLLRR
jgi:hypothetical protein